jgi:Holliday junction resolvase
MTPEGKVKKQVKVVLDALGAYYFMPATGGYGRSGVPDFVGCFRGHFFGIECKAGSNKPTALQEREMTKINRSGGFSFLVNEDNVHEVEQAFTQWSYK